MSKLKVLTAQKVVKKLKRAGFTECHQRGSHLTLKNGSTCKFVTVPMHSGDIPKGTLYNIIVRQTGLSVDEFNNL